MRGLSPDEGTPDKPRVTIVTAIFNSRRHFERCIDSVREQTYPNVEYVVADGGSSDGTLDLLAERDDDIDYWVSERDRGMFDGMNRGIAVSTGELVKIQGADDVMPKDSVALAVERYLEHRHRADRTVVRSEMELVDEQERQLQLVGDATRFGHSPAILHPTWYVPMALYERLGLYDPYPVVSGDYEYYFYLRERGVHFECVTAPLVRFRVGGTSTATLKGFADTFHINRRYQGLRVATQLAAVTGFRRGSRMLLERAIGARRLGELRRRLQRRS